MVSLGLSEINKGFKGYFNGLTVHVLKLRRLKGGRGLVWFLAKVYICIDECIRKGDFEESFRVVMGYFW